MCVRELFEQRLFSQPTDQATLAGLPATMRSRGLRYTDIDGTVLFLSSVAISGRCNPRNMIAAPITNPSTLAKAAWIVALPAEGCIFTYRLFFQVGGVECKSVYVRVKCIQEPAAAARLGPGGDGKKLSGAVATMERL